MLYHLFYKHQQNKSGRNRSAWLMCLLVLIKRDKNTINGCVRTLTLVFSIRHRSYVQRSKNNMIKQDNDLYAVNHHFDLVFIIYGLSNVPLPPTRTSRGQCPRYIWRIGTTCIVAFIDQMALILTHICREYAIIDTEDAL